MPKSPRGSSFGLPNNALLKSLPPEEFARLRRELVIVSMVAKAVLLEPDRPVEQVYFVESGIISLVSVLEDGARVEVGLVGFDGMAGLPVLLGSGSSLWEGLVQVEGTALRLSATAFRTALVELPSLLPLMLRYVDAIQTQIVQSAVCNARHPLEQRLARWILATDDRVSGSSFLMTQEFMATMLGVRRPGVTLALGALQRAGLVRHERQTLHVLDRANLEAASCECYRVVRGRIAWLLDQ